MKKNCYKLLPLALIAITLGACTSNSADNVEPDDAFNAIEKAAKRTSESEKTTIKTVDDPIYAQMGVEIKNDTKWNYVTAKVEHMPLDITYSGYDKNDASKLKASIVSKGSGEDAPGADIKLNTDISFGDTDISGMIPRIDDLALSSYVKDGTYYVDYSDSSLSLIVNLVKVAISQIDSVEVTLPKNKKAKASLDEEGLDKVNELIGQFEIDTNMLKDLYNDVPSLFVFNKDKITLKATTKEEFRSYLEAAYDLGSKEANSEDQSSLQEAKEDIFSSYDKYMEYASFSSFETSISFNENGLSSISSSLNISSFDHDGLVNAFPEETALPYGKFSYSGKFEFSYDKEPSFPSDLDEYGEIVVTKKETTI